MEHYKQLAKREPSKYYLGEITFWHHFQESQMNFYLKWKFKSFHFHLIRADCSEFFIDVVEPISDVFPFALLKLCLQFL